jgi:E3 ubiquitin-protein ligase SHPRH
LQDGRERFRILSSVSLTTRDLDEPMLDDEGLVPTEKEMVATLNIDVHVNLDAIAAGGSDLINEFTGFILHSLLPAKLAAYASEADARTAGIKDLYACLRPAPPLPFGGKPNDLQPKMMRSRLLPFQQRTVHKLIEREKCAEMAEQDTFLAQDPSGSWTQLDTDGSGAESSDRYAYRRVTGTVVKLPRQKGGAPSRKGKERELAAEDLEDEYGLTRRDKEALTAAIDVSGVRGTMLCEEMGESGPS